MVKRRVRVSVEFATTRGAVETLEGPVEYEGGDAIVTGATGERWPVPRATFLSRYRPIADGGDGGEGGDGPYESLAEPAWAVHLGEGDAPLDVVTPAGAVLHAACGDWIVEGGPGDVHVVNGDLFSALYEECN